MTTAERLASFERMLARIEERLTVLESKVSDLAQRIDDDTRIFITEIDSIKTLMMAFESRVTRLENIPRTTRKIMKCFSV